MNIVIFSILLCLFIHLRIVNLQEIEISNCLSINVELKWEDLQGNNSTAPDYIDNLLNYPIFLKYFNPKSINLQYKLDPNRSIIFRSNDTLKLPFLTRFGAEKCNIFKIFPDPNIHENPTKVVEGLIRLIQNSSFGFDEDNAHFLIFIVSTVDPSHNGITDLQIGDESSTVLKLFENGIENIETESEDLLISGRLTLFHVNINVNVGNTEQRIQVRWGHYCYQCMAEHKILRWHKDNEIDIQNSIHPDDSGNEKAFIFSKTKGEADEINNIECTGEKYGMRHAKCYASHILLGLMATKLNLTLVPYGMEPEPKEPGLHLCLLCNPREHYDLIRYPSPEVYYDNFRKFSLIYCNTQRKFEPPEWSMLTQPFDRYVWICIFATCLAFAAVHRDFGYGCDILLLILSQPTQKKWAPGLSVSLLCLIVLTYGYLGIVTTDLTEPLYEKPIADVKSLLYGKRYKFVAPSEDVMTVLVDQYIKPVLPNLKFERDMYQLDENVTLELFLNNPLILVRKLAEVQGSCGIPDMGALQPFLQKGLRIRMGNSSCMSVTEGLPTQMLWILRLNGVKKGLRTLWALRRAGIGNFWETIQLRNRVVNILNKVSADIKRDELFGISLPQALVMESSPKIVFSLYAILISGGSLVFLVEIIKTKFFSGVKRNKIFTKQMILNTLK